MSRVYRVAAVAAASALVLSLLIGLIAGVRFGTVLIRAVLGAFVFGAGGVGLAVLAGRMLPGLLEDAPVAKPSHREEEGSEPRQNEAEVRRPRTVDIVVEDDIDGDEEEARSDEELVEEVQEQIVDDEEAAMAATIEEQSGNENSRVVDESSEDMPDIGAFAGSFVSVGGEGDAEALDYGETVQEKSGATGKGGNDPVVIARALQTMMKRDGD